jgi:hypothetical protein
MRMASWGFWEWLTYGCIAVAAMMIAIDQGVQRSDVARKFLGSIVRSPLWAFTPFSLILLSAALILWHVLSASVPATPPNQVTVPVPAMKSAEVGTAPVGASQSSQLTAIPADNSAQVEVNEPNDLNEETNQDVRQYAYIVDQGLEELTKQYYHDFTAVSGTVDKVASNKLALAEKLNRDFRQKYEQKIIRLNSELARRLKINDASRISFSSNRIDAVAIEQVGYNLIQLANQLP